MKIASCGFEKEQSKGNTNFLLMNTYIYLNGKQQLKHSIETKEDGYTYLRD